MTLKRTERMVNVPWRRVDGIRLPSNVLTGWPTTPSMPAVSTSPSTLTCAKTALHRGGRRRHWRAHGAPFAA